MQPLQKYTRYCPGEEHILISDAVCFGRRRANYPKCAGCRFNDDEKRQRRQGLAPKGQKQPEHTAMDKVFKAYDVRGIYPDPLNEDVAWRIGYGTGTFLRGALRGVDRSERRMNRVVVGRDMRRSSPAMAEALIAGLRACGAGVVDIDMIDTSQLYFAVNHMECCGGIQTTASHNPANYNGFKICGVGGVPVGGDTGLQEIRGIAATTAPYEPPQLGPLEHQDLTAPYRDFVLSFLKLERPLKVVIDASNGMAGRWVPRIFDDVENLKILPINFRHDGKFKHDPNPLVAANLEQTRRRVEQRKADFGACFDGDADRCMLVDENSEIIPCDLLTALLAEYFLESTPGSPILYDLRSSRIVAETVRRGGGQPRRERVGHAFMKKAMAESDAVFGGELSGHFYFKDNWFCDSGLLAFVHVLNILSRGSAPLSELVAPYRKYHASGEQNFKNEDQDGTIQKLATHYADATVDHLDGITIEHPEWWFNVRKSNTEPLLRLNLEANTPQLLDTRLAEVAAMLGEPVDH